MRLCYSVQQFDQTELLVAVNYASIAIKLNRIDLASGYCTTGLWHIYQSDCWLMSWLTTTKL